ncbi:MAG: site-2 protease family protein [Helicobacteraceae bacterium]|jgi:Zn-dependent protease|nr:site-2 protease family protein [Helicobacteraceae bacterium]
MSLDALGSEFTRLLLMVAALFISIVGHEIAHGAMALFFGDTTAKDMRRLSINPINHIDPMGTIAVPLLLYVSGAPFLFGWAKPVPIDVNVVLRRGHMAMVAVSLAGIAFNLILAFIAMQILKVDISAMSIDAVTLPVFDQFLRYLVTWNVVLAVFNLLPIPPLDGSNALTHIFARFGVYSVGNFFYRVRMWGMVAVVIIFMTDLSQLFVYAVNSVIKLML